MIDFSALLTHIKSPKLRQLIVLLILLGFAIYCFLPSIINHNSNKCDKYAISGNIDVSNIDCTKIRLRLNGDIRNSYTVAADGGFNFSILKSDSKTSRIDVFYKGELKTQVQLSEALARYNDETCTVTIQSKINDIIDKTTFQEDKKISNKSSLVKKEDLEVKSTSEKKNPVNSQTIKKIRIIFGGSEVGGLIQVDKDTLGTVSSTQYSDVDINVSNRHKIFVYKENSKICEDILQTNKDRTTINCPNR